jgi:hypothetical protein
MRGCLPKVAITDEEVLGVRARRLRDVELYDFAAATNLLVRR